MNSKDQTTPTELQKKSLVRALERRFGQSINPYRFQRNGFVVAYNSPVWRVTDTESGSYIEGLFYHGRLNVRKEFDGAA